MAASLIYILTFFFMVFFLFKFYYPTKPPITTKTPPPSPPKLPIIGNLHQLGPLVHRSFHSLSRRYGDHGLMLLHLGSTPTLVVSSSDSAREIMQIHDLAFASKPPIQMYKTLFYDSKEISVAPYGEYWRQAKKAIVLHYLSNKMVQTFSGVRDQEISVIVGEVEKLSVNMSNKVVNLSDLLFQLSNSISCRATFGGKYNEGETGRKFKKVLKDLLEVFTAFYFVDSIPRLAWIDQISGANSKIKNVAKDIDAFLEMVIQERIAKIEAGEVDEGVEPFVDALIRIQKEDVNGFCFDREAVKALLMDSYLAGTDTSWTASEWVMTELLAHPSVLKTVQDEVRAIVNGKQNITETDVEQMKYLKAVIMETTRLHPPVPVAPPRFATTDVKVMGFDIEKGTWVFVNLWAIGRDPKVWDRPNEFVPERFLLEGSVDFVKNEFKFIPFGGGRRRCPGRVFAMAVVENTAANLLCKFNWELPRGEKEEGIDMNEAAGLTCEKKTPLLAFATPFLFVAKAPRQVTI